MSWTNRSGILSLAGIFATRMLGMFLLMPVLSLATQDIPSVTPFLAGLALGIYGLFQAALQMPFGLLSDRYGRKNIMTLGLLLFLLGSVVAALSSSIMGLIVGRSLQGMGAIGSTTLAFIADITPEEERSQAMAIVGLNIALSFGLAMLLSSSIYSHSGLSGIFWVTSGMAIISLILLHTAVPNPECESFHRDTSVMLSELQSMLAQKELIRLAFGIFTLHALLTAVFLVLPQMVAQASASSSLDIYAPALIGALPIMLGGTFVGEKQRIIKGMLLGVIIALIASVLLLSLVSPTKLTVIMALLIFFSAFGLGESFLPSLVSKITPANRKGTAMGIFSSSQFLGSFAGAYFGGIILTYFDPQHLLFFVMGLCVLWLMITLPMKQPSYLSSYLVKVNLQSSRSCQQLEQHLLSIKGLYEAKIMSDDGIAYLKFDSRMVNRPSLDSILADWLKQRKLSEE